MVEIGIGKRFFIGEDEWIILEPVKGGVEVDYTRYAADGDMINETFTLTPRHALRLAQLLLEAAVPQL